MLSNRAKKRLYASSACVALSALIASVAAAQSADQGARATAQAQPASAQNSQPGLEEIVVTAERRESTVQRTAAEITVADSQDLDRQHVTDLAGLQALLPNLQIYTITNNLQFSIRGIGSTFIDPRADPDVALSLNGLFLDRSMPAGFGLVDVSRVEALNGPQGTLYGRNSAAGAVNIISNQPTDKFEGLVSATAGNLETANVTGVVNIPVTDNLAVRLAYERDRSEGYVADYYNDVHIDYGRAIVRWTPTDRLTVVAEWDHDRMGGHGGTGVSYPCPGSTPYGVFVPVNCVAPNSLLYGTNTTFTDPLDGQSSETVDAYQLHLDYDAGPVRLTSISGYVLGRTNYLNQNGAIFAPMAIGPDGVRVPPGTGIYGDHISNIARDVTEEFRVAGTDDATHAGGLAWVAGAFIFSSSGNYDLESDLGSSDYTVLPQRSQAGFGQFTYGVTDSLRLTGGVRYTHDYKGVELGAGPPPPPLVTINDNNWSYKGGLEFDLTRANMLYADVSTGYISGGPNGGVPGNPQPPGSPAYADNTFPAETLTAYEAGSKNRFFDNRVQLNADFYYYDFKNYELFIPSLLAPPNPQTIYTTIQTVPKVTTYGFEAAAAFAATRDDSFNASLQLAHGEFGGVTLSAGGVAFVPFFHFVANPYVITDGTRLLNLPQWQGTLGYDHTFRLKNNSSLVFSIASKLSGNFLTTVTENGAVIPSDIQHAYTRTDMNLAYHFPDDRLLIRAWVKNVENSYVNLYGEGAQFYLYDPLPPRTYGVTVTMKF
jgi:iron complex outermembrane receptor protein